MIELCNISKTYEKENVLNKINLSIPSKKTTIIIVPAYGLGLGASGLTFFDDGVTRFFSPHAQGKSTMFLMALGKSVKNNSDVL